MKSTQTPKDTSWLPPLYEAQAKRARMIAVEVARRCCDWENVQKAEKILPPGVLGTFTAESCCEDLAFLATYIHRVYPDQEWDRIAHSYLETSIAARLANGPRMSLHGGVSGLVLTTALCSQDGKHYAQLQQSLDAYLCEAVPGFLEKVKTPKLRASIYDVITGAAGIAACLTFRYHTSGDETIKKRCQDILQWLVLQTMPDGENGLYYFISPENIYQPERREAFPEGYSDMGLAHGIAGVVATLALALRENLSVPGVSDCLSTLTDWLIGRQIHDVYGVQWPNSVTPSDMSINGQPGGRATWCYGTPGIARAIYLAGDALDSAHLKQASLNAFDGLIARPRHEWGISSPNLCHGLGGILESTMRMYQDTGEPRLLPFIEQVATELLSLYDSETLFGFQDRESQDNPYDNPRFLNGASGVALVLLAASSSVLPEWDHFLLLS